MGQTLFLHFPKNDNRITIVENSIAGRDHRRCNLLLPDYLQGPIQTISGRHFKISRREAGDFVLIDLGSSNGTQLNGESLEPYAERILRDGDIIKLAKNDDFLIQVLIELEPDDFQRYAETVATLEIVSQVNTAGLRWDQARQQFFVDGILIPDKYLSEVEMELLSHLYQHQDEVCSYSSISDHVWGYPMLKNTISQTVRGLRQKLNGISPSSGEHIQNVRGYGYKCIFRKR